MIFSRRCEDISALDFFAERLQKKKSENMKNLLKN